MLTSESTKLPTLTQQPDQDNSKKSKLETGRSILILTKTISLSPFSSRFPRIRLSHWHAHCTSTEWCTLNRICCHLNQPQTIAKTAEGTRTVTQLYREKHKQTYFSNKTKKLVLTKTRTNRWKVDTFFGKLNRNQISGCSSEHKENLNDPFRKTIKPHCESMGLFEEDGLTNP